jgi:hypothetical protein
VALVALADAQAAGAAESRVRSRPVWYNRKVCQ